MTDAIPAIALSVRQPWAWAIIHAGKPVENRSEASVRMGGMRPMIGRRIAIHAAKGLTREEYDDAREFMAGIGVHCPAADALERGGLIGTVHVDDIVSDHASPWFFGPRALALSRPMPVPFVGATGSLGMFEWSGSGSGPATPAKWMRPARSRTEPPRNEQGSLL